LRRQTSRHRQAARRIYSAAALSDEKRVALVRFDPRTADIWLLELGRGVLSRLTSDPAHRFRPCLVARQKSNCIRLAAKASLIFIKSSGCASATRRVV